MWIFPTASELNKNPVEGFSAGLVDDDDIYQWEVVVIGPQDTLLWVRAVTDEITSPRSWALHPLTILRAHLNTDLSVHSEGGFFKATLSFPRDYPLRPPKMKFITEIWHPNGENWLLCETNGFNPIILPALYLNGIISSTQPITGSGHTIKCVWCWG